MPLGFRKNILRNGKKPGRWRKRGKGEGKCEGRREESQRPTWLIVSRGQEERQMFGTLQKSSASSVIRKKYKLNSEKLIFIHQVGKVLQVDNRKCWR